VASVLLQSCLADEIIVVDDGSTDNTSQIQEDFQDIIYIFQSNKGVSSARNRGIFEAKSDWIAFLDSDDVWHEDKLQQHVAFHRQNRDIFMSYTDEKWVRGDKEVKVPKKFKKIGKDAFVENMSYCNIAPSSALIHKKVFDKYGLFDESLEVCEDYDLWLRIACSEKIGLINEKLITKYAGHEDQLSFKHWGMDRFRVKSLEKFLDTEHEYLVLETLIQKYLLLLKGAIKYDKIADIEIYESKLEFLKLNKD